jgi:hypothetical protein
MQLGKDQWREYQKAGLKIPAVLTVPRQEALEVQAIVTFPDGAAGVGTLRLNMPGSDESGARATSLLLTSRVDPVGASSNAAPDPLRVQNYKLALAPEWAFTSTESLTLYFGIGNVAMDPASGRPLLQVSVAVKSKDAVVRQIPGDTLYPLEPAQDRLFFLSQFSLAGMAPGAYTVEATVKDLKKKTSTVQTAGFRID